MSVPVGIGLARRGHEVMDCGEAMATPLGTTSVTRYGNTPLSYSLRCRILNTAPPSQGPVSPHPVCLGKDHCPASVSGKSAPLAEPCPGRAKHDAERPTVNCVTDFSDGPYIRLRLNEQAAAVFPGYLCTHAIACQAEGCS